MFIEIYRKYLFCYKSQLWSTVFILNLWCYDGVDFSLLTIVIQCFYRMRASTALIWNTHRHSISIWISTIVTYFLPQYMLWSHGWVLTLPACTVSRNMAPFLCMYTDVLRINVVRPDLCLSFLYKSYSFPKAHQKNQQRPSHDHHLLPLHCHWLCSGQFSFLYI